MVPWGDPSKLPGGYSLKASYNDITFYMPIPLRCLRSVEMFGKSGFQGEVKVLGEAPCCFGWCGLFGVRQNTKYPVTFFRMLGSVKIKTNDVTINENFLGKSWPKTKTLARN